jgi:hypothetical protein
MGRFERPIWGGLCKSEISDFGGKIPPETATACRRFNHGEPAVSTPSRSWSQASYPRIVICSPLGLVNPRMPRLPPPCDLGLALSPVADAIGGPWAHEAGYDNCLMTT